MRAALAMAGHVEYPYDPEGAISRLSAGRVDASVRDAAIARFAQAIGRPADEIRANLDRRTAP
jgi:hypothetical protein